MVAFESLAAPGGLPIRSKASHPCLVSITEELAKRFARAGSDKFSGISTQLDSARHDQAHAFESVPHLAGCSARFDCMTESTHLAGDHCIIVARVLFFEATELEPLVFAHSGFFGLSKH